MGKKPPSIIGQVDAIRAAASTRWPEILSTVGNVSREILDGKHHPCPKCGGKDRFRFLDEQAGALFCNGCFNTKNGDGFAAIQWLLGCDFKKSLRLVADYVGVQAHKEIDPAEQLSWRDWNDALILRWCELHKRGVKPEAIKACGGRIARYLDQHIVVAFPIWGKEQDVVGWCVYPLSGGKLPKYAKHSSVEWLKVKVTYGSKPGLIGPIDQVTTATTIWKLEGPSDVLAFLSLPERPTDAIAITNSNGTLQIPIPWMLHPWEGKAGPVLHDADKPGEEGGNRWAEAIATVATECRRYRLPYQIVDSHGPDLRDWTCEGHNYVELTNLPNDLVARPTVSIYRPIEADSDPHRLARVNIAHYAKITNGGVIKYWRDEWYLWRNNHYRKIEHKELFAKVGATIKAEFDRLNVEAQENAKDDEPPKVQSVTSYLINNVLAATATMVIISGRIELNSYLPQRETKNWVAMSNGIVDLDALLDDRDEDEVIRQHTPDWFSTVCLPYAFNPEADCPTFKKVIHRCMEGDQERISLLQEWAGYLLLPDNSQQKFLVLEGEGGNGKSAFMAAIQSMVGSENCSPLTLEKFNDKFALYTTVGKLLNVGGDMGEIDKAAEGNLKSFTGGDAIYFDRKGISGISCRPTARLMFATNNRPRFSDKSMGLWRRMILIPWRVQIPVSERILGMDNPDWWRKSGELPGIFRWAIEGLCRVRTQKGFSSSKICDTALADYRRETNPAREFLEENLQRDEECKVSSSKLYEFYKSWAHSSGYHPFGATQFGREVHRVFPHIERKQLRESNTREWYYVGICFAVDQIGGATVFEAQLF